MGSCSVRSVEICYLLKWESSELFWHVILLLLVYSMRNSKVFRNFTVTCYVLVEMAKISVTVLEWLIVKNKGLCTVQPKVRFPVKLLNCILFSLSWHHHSAVPLSSHSFGRNTKPEFILQKTSQVKGRFVFVWGKNKNKPSIFQTSFMPCKDTKDCLGPILTFFYCWRIPNDMKFFLYKLP